MIEFFIRMNPPTATAQQKGAMVTKQGKIHFYKKKRVAEAERELINAIRAYAPATPYDGPIGLAVEWRFERHKSHKHNEWRSTYPDTDNLQKMLKDTMTEAGFWTDDARVVKETAQKIWVDDDKAGLYIRVLELGRFKTSLPKQGEGVQDLKKS